MPKPRKNGKPKDPERVEKRKKEFVDYMRREVLEGYDQPSERVNDFETVQFGI